MKYQYQHINEEGFITPYFYNTLDELLNNHPEATSYFILNSNNIYVMTYL